VHTGKALSSLDTLRSHADVRRAWHP